MKVFALVLGVSLSLAFLTFIPDAFGKEIILEKTLEINIILIGDEWTSSEMDVIERNLPSSFDPSIILTGDKLGIRYNYEYSFFSQGPEKASAGLFSFMKSKAVDHSVYGDGLFDSPIWQEWWIKVKHPEWIEKDSSGEFLRYKIPYKINDAEEVEKYIYDRFIANNSDLNKPNSVNLVFLKGDLSQLDYLHNYYLAQRDKSSNEVHNAMGMMGYGGNYNLYFFDLYAVPWVNIDLEQGKWIIPPYMTTLHDCTASTCLSTIIAFHTNSALSQIVTPDYTYPVDYKSNYIVDVVLYSKPGSSFGLTPQTAEKFFNKAEIKSELENLFPYANWDIKLSLEKRDTRGLTYDFKKQLESARHFVIPNLFGEEKAIQLLNSDKLQPYLRSWAYERTGSGNIEQITGSASSWVIPVLIVVSSSIQDVYLDGYGVTGFAPPHLKNPDQPCCALGVTDEKDLWEDKVGVSDLVLHEVGHVLGLTHPFQKWNAFGVEENYYFNWYASPMTYSGAPKGCGLLYDLLYSDTCGIASASYTEFERQHIADAIFVSLIKTAASNLEYYSNEDPPTEESRTMVKNITLNLEKAIERFQLGDTLSNEGAIKYAILATKGTQGVLEVEDKKEIMVDDKELVFVDGNCMDTNDILYSEEKYFHTIDFADGSSIVFDLGFGKISKITIDCSIPSLIFETSGSTGFQNEISLPIKLFGGYLSIEVDGEKVDYHEKTKDYQRKAITVFDHGQTYEFSKLLIPSSLLKTEQHEKEEQSSSSPSITGQSEEKERIPKWIKNNAEWWSEGQIGDSDFVGGIQYLIKENIISIPDLPQSDSSTQETIPEWIKTVAGYWADDMISEEDFIMSIQYLVENGIIKV